MKYAVVKVINGNFFIHAEGYTNENSAIVEYHQLCAILWNADDVITAAVMIVNEELNYMSRYCEIIDKRPKPKEETTSES